MALIFISCFFRFLRSHKRPAAAAACLFVFSIASAQNPHPSFRHYSVEDGLSSSEVYHVKQDSKGYIWFATGNGVSRFNGYEFENFSMSQGLPDNTVFDIFEDSIGRIWFMPISGKLSYYYRGRIYLYKYNYLVKDIIANSFEVSFGVDGKGTVYIGVSRRGIYSITSAGKIIRPLKEQPPVLQWGVTEIAKGSLVYVNPSTAAGQHTMPHRHPHTPLHYNLPDWKDSIFIDTCWVDWISNMHVIRTRSNELMLAANKTVAIIDLAKHSVRMISFPEQINYLYEDRDGDLWLGMLQAGVRYVPGRDFSRQEHYLRGSSVDGITQDKEGGFWFATEENGVYYSPSKNVLTYDELAGWKDGRINCLATDGRHVFAGSHDGFIYTINADGSVHADNCNVGSAQVNSVKTLHYTQREKKLWYGASIASCDDMIRMMHMSDLQVSFNSILWHNNAYWIAYFAGVKRYDNKGSTKEISINGVNFRRTNALLEKDDHTLLIGSLDGLWEFNTNTMEAAKRNPNPLLQQRVLDLARLPGGLLAVATKGTGLLICDGQRVHQLHISNGLSGDNVYKLWADDSVLWAATNNGINRITVTGIKPFRCIIQQIHMQDGLPSDEVKDVIKAQGKIWVATNRGLSAFYEDSLLNNHAVLPVFITRVMINDRDTGVYRSYTLRYNENNIRIGFTALGYKDAGKMHYRYKMIGLDTVWNYTDNREIQYTTLPANDYTFQLSVLNPDGRWSEHTTEVSFAIYAPFWQKWWFRFLLVVALTAAMIGVLSYRARMMAAQRHKSEDLHKSLLHLKLKALRAQMNPHFIFNVMNSIQLFALDSDSESTSRYLSKFSRLVRAILNNSDRNTISLEEEIRTLELYLDLEVMRFENRFDYAIVVEEGIDIMDVEIPPMLIQPYLENSLKHGILPSKKQGRLTVQMNMQDKILTCVIEDNGVGRGNAADTTDPLHKSLGTSITKERLAVINELYNSTLTETITDLKDENNIPAGTRVEIHIPIS